MSRSRPQTITELALWTYCHPLLEYRRGTTQKYAGWRWRITASELCISNRCRKEGTPPKHPTDRHRINLPPKLTSQPTHQKRGSLSFSMISAKSLHKSYQHRSRSTPHLISLCPLCHMKTNFPLPISIELKPNKFRPVSSMVHFRPHSRCTTTFCTGFRNHSPRVFTNLLLSQCIKA